MVALLLLSSSCFEALDSRSLTNCFTCSFWAGFAYCPRSVDAAIRRMEFWIAMLSVETTLGTSSPLTAVVSTASPLIDRPFASSCASKRDL